jgi:hypothetical protein
MAFSHFETGPYSGLNTSDVKSLKEINRPKYRSGGAGKIAPCRSLGSFELRDMEIAEPGRRGNADREKMTITNFVPAKPGNETARRSTESMNAGPSPGVASGVTPAIDV